MNRHCRVGLQAFWVSAGLLAPSGAYAAGGGRLQYAAPDGCPTRAEFEAAVAARGGQFSADPAGDGAFEVDITHSADAFQASLVVQSAASTSNPRELRARSCAEVVEALAVVTAIALNAPMAGQVKPEPQVNARPRAATELTRPPLRGAGDVWSRTVDVEAGKLHLDHALRLDAFAGPVLRLVPERALERLDIGVSRANFVTAPDGQSFLMGTIVRLRGSLLFDQTYRFGEFRTQVGGQEVGAGLCFSPHYDSAGWVLLGCAEISAGLIGLRTKDASGRTTQDKTQGFGTVGIGVEASYYLAAHFQLGVRLGVQALTSPLTAERPGGSELFHSSTLVPSGMFGVGTHF